MSESGRNARRIPRQGSKPRLRPGISHGTLRKTKLRGIAKVTGGFFVNLIAYNLIHIPKLIKAQAGLCSKPGNMIETGKLIRKP